MREADTSWRTAVAVGQWARRRFVLSTSPGILDVCIGVVLILLPLLVGRVVALGGWPASPVSFLLIASGVGLEFLAWSAGFGAVLTNAFGFGGHNCCLVVGALE